MDLAVALQQLAIALGLGLLVGLQRERAASPLAGLRTFALAAVLGTLCGQLAPVFGPWLPAAGLVALAGLIAAGNLLLVRAAPSDIGLTTEVALLLLYVVGVALAAGYQEVALVVGGSTAVLLYLKPELHGFAGRIGEKDFRAIMQFAVLSLVILPGLPNRPYGPYGVLNPQQIWLMVVLVVGLGLAGYVGYKLLGERRGALVAGLLGGVVSSTATTVSYARRSRELAAATGGVGAAGAALVIVLASAVVFGRILVELAITAPALLRAAALPLGLLLALALLLGAALWKRGMGAAAGDGIAAPENPSQLKPALLFGLLYAVVLLAVAFARDRLDSRGLYLVAVLSGLTDVDAITLSTGRLVSRGSLPADLGWRLVVTAALANLAFKAGIVAVLGTRRLLAWVAACFGVVVVGGVVLLAWWR
jgi:uncharacterized membrane protein (DUF4010 family)